jgi:IMP dehydrogenase/GMP reductase
MPSEDKQARQTQKQHYQGAIESRRNLLVQRGVDKVRIPKDPRLKHLQAMLRKTTKRLAALAALEKQNEEMALRKQQKLVAKTEDKPADSHEQGKKKEKQGKKKEKKKQAS